MFTETTQIKQATFELKGKKSYGIMARALRGFILPYYFRQKMKIGIALF